MDDYFKAFPDKHPKPRGSIEQRDGDDMYFREAGRWLRLPCAEHNSVGSFRQDQGRRVYLAEGADSFWYFGAAHPMSEPRMVADLFPWFIQDRQGFKYVRDVERIRQFSEWLTSFGQRGLVGEPRDRRPIRADRYLTAIDPMPIWRDGGPVGSGQSSAFECGSHSNPQRRVKRGC